MASEMFTPAPAHRVEDDVFLRGEAKYLDDLKFSGQSFAVFVRSTEAHATINSLKTVQARSMPGVLGVFTAADVSADGLKPIRPSVEINPHDGSAFNFIPQPLLAEDRVRYVGEPIALVVAETLDQAQTAAEHVGVEYDVLTSVSDARSAAGPDAAPILPDTRSNICFDFEVGDQSAVEEAFAKAFRVTALKITNHRIVTNPMEPRGLVGFFDVDSGRYTAIISSQKLHSIRDRIAESLCVSEDKVRLKSPEIGGNFGSRNFTYPEYALILWAAKKLGRPVRWTATRSEVFLADHQARDHFAEAKLALDSSGRFLALQVESHSNVGAYLVSTAGVHSGQYLHLPGTIYNIPAAHFRVRGVFTNTAPIGVTRGPGFAEAVNVMERLVDTAARQIGFDQGELRRINMFPASSMPVRNVFGNVIDSGSFSETLDKAQDLADVAGFPQRREKSLQSNLLRGIGYAYHIKGTGGEPTEAAEIIFEPDGFVTLKVGTHSTGQGHATAFPQVVGGLLGIDPSLVRLLQADTDLLPVGGGSASSRSIYMAGTAMWHCCNAMIEAGRLVAAELLEVDPESVDFNKGLFLARGTNRSVGIEDVAANCNAGGKPLSAYKAWTRDAVTFPNGAHIVEVEVNPTTGEVRLDRYTAVDDYGNIVNPIILEGQIHGAIAQGIGQALTEHVVYDENSGQLLTGSFMDYALPRADDVPIMSLALNGTPCATNPLGVKGVGESGAIAAYPAIHNAVEDALSPLGDIEIDAPLTPEKIWRAIR